MADKLNPITPGEILLEEFLIPNNLSQEQLSRDIDVPKSRISAIVHGRRAISADTALRLAAYFGTSAEFWLNLQDGYNLDVLRQTTWPIIEPRIRKFSAA